VGSKGFSSPARIWAAFLLVRTAVFLFCRESTGDIAFYFSGALPLFEGENPYEKAGFGYPPFALGFVALPFLLSGGNFVAYTALFKAQCYLVDVCIFSILMKRDPSRGAPILYLLSTSLLGNLLYHRLDITLALLLVLALELHRLAWPRLSSVVFGLSIAFKVLPVVCAPAIVAIGSRTFSRMALARVALLILGAMVPTALGFLIWGSAAILFLAGHGARGIQVESTWASIEALMLLAGSTGEVYWAAGCYNLNTPLEGIFVWISHGLFLAVALVGGVMALRVPAGRLGLLVAATLAAALLVSKVLSPQFFLFLFAVISFALPEIERRRSIIVVILAIAVLTTWVYPYHEEHLTRLELVATLPLILRNGLLGYLVYLLAHEVWDQRHDLRLARESTAPGSGAGQPEVPLDADLGVE
jgi:hypothetical protein